MILKISCTQNHVCQTIPKVNIDSSFSDSSTEKRLIKHL